MGKDRLIHRLTCIKAGAVHTAASVERRCSHLRTEEPIVDCFDDTPCALGHADKRTCPHWK